MFVCVCVCVCVCVRVCMAWKTGAVPVVAGLGLESDANLFIYLFTEKK